MIVVTGTKRAGTSLWMQVLRAAGLPVLGDAFPAQWGDAIRAANPRGFYESRLRQGIFYATNPDPATGAYLAPGAVRRHAVKVFIPGVVRSDVAYLDRVIATLRDWRTYGPSLTALYAAEDAWAAANPPPGRTGAEALALLQRRRGDLPPAVEWYLENFELLRDFAVRRYPFHMTTYAALVADPAPVIARVCGWIGGGDPDAGAAAVDPALSRTPPGPTPPELDAESVRVFDDLYAAVHTTSSIPASLQGDLNATWTRLHARYGHLSRERGREDHG